MLELRGNDAGSKRGRVYSPTKRWQETLLVKRNKVKNDKMMVIWKKRNWQIHFPTAGRRFETGLCCGKKSMMTWLSLTI